MGTKILLVEDSSDDVFLIRKSMTKARLEAELIHCDSAATALAYLRLAAPPPDLVILDIKLPGENGFEVLKWIRHNSGDRAVPVFMHSGSSLEVDRALARSLGADAYIVKTAGYESLVDRIKGWQETQGSRTER